MTALVNDAASTARLSANLAIVPQASDVLNTIKISRYVRGQLIDISSIAREAGLRVPTALTSCVWMQAIKDMYRPVAFADVRVHEETIWQIVREVQDELRKSPGRASWRVVILSKPDWQGCNWLLEVTARLEVGANGETVLVISDPTDLFV